MSLIAGYINRGRPSCDSRVQQSIRSFSIIPQDNTDLYENHVRPIRSGHLVAKHSTQSPCQVRTCENNNWLLTTLGFNNIIYDNCQKQFADARPLTEENAPRQLEKSEGEFVSFLYDRQACKLHIINDRFSTRPFYYLSNKDGIFFSSNILYLLKMTTTCPDYDCLGLLQIFSYGHTIGKRTNFTGINRLLPGSHLEISDGILTEKQYWKLKHDPVENLDAKEHADKTFESFQKSVSNRVHLYDSGFSTLSGGLDSRMVVAALPKDCDYFCFTFDNSTGTGESLEVEVARQICEILQRQHRVEKMLSSEISSTADYIIRLTGGLTPIHHPAKTNQSIKIMQECGGYKLGGGPGDTLAGSFISKSVHNLMPSMTARTIYKFIVWRKRFKKETLSRIFREHVIDEYYGKLDESLEKSFANLAGPSAAHRITAWASLTCRQPAFTFTSPIHNHPFVTEASPHLGYDYVENMLRLPANFLIGRNFYKFMICHCAGSLRNVIYANTGKHLPDAIPKINIPVKKKLLAAIEKMIPPKPLEQFRMRKTKISQDESFEFNVLKKDTGMLNEIEEILHSYGKLSDLLDIEKCSGYLKTVKSGGMITGSKANEAELLGSLATVCYLVKNL